MVEQSFKWKGEEIPRPALKPCAHCASPAEYTATWPMIGDSETAQHVKALCSNRTGCGISGQLVIVDWTREQPYHEAFARAGWRWNRRV